MTHQELQNRPLLQRGMSISSRRERPRVAIGHPYVGRGGSEATVMWLIEALKRDYELTIVTTGGWNRSALNSFYGTQVEDDDIKVRIAPVPFPVKNLSVAAMRGTCCQRFARQIAGEYDIRISAYNPIDWGAPAIHFIADFSWSQEIRDLLDPPTPGFIYRDSALRKAYLRWAEAHGNPSGRNVLKDDMLIANSLWSANLLKDQYGVACADVVYPCVWSEFPDIAWEDKEQAFAMIGRISPEKQIERAIAILDEVRSRGHHFRFHICGQVGDDKYGRRIAKLCKERASWIVLEGTVTGARKAGILSRCRFGIQARSAEPFGISVAEMVKAGAIVFAPNNGGQTEVLKSPELQFSDLADAVEKIDTVLSDPQKQALLKTHLSKQAGLFKAYMFTSQCRAIVAMALSKRTNECAYV